MEEENVLENCSVGEFRQEDCHKETHCKTKGITKLSIFGDETQSLIIARAGAIADGTLFNICDHHFAILITKYAFYQRKCCDPFDIHKRAVNSHVIFLSIGQANQFQPFCEKLLAPGQKICRNCLKRLQDRQIEAGNTTSNESSLTCTPRQETPSSSQEPLLEEHELYFLNKSLKDLGASPMNLHAINTHQRATYAKRKISETVDVLKTKVNKALHIPTKVLCQDSYEEELISDLKKKVANSSKQEKCKLLTILPKSWTITRTCEEFGVSKYLAQLSKKLRKEVGILPEIEKTRGKTLPQETVDTVITFFQNDEVTRMCPGKKEYVSVSINGEKSHKQKRLILSNIKEVYLQFKEENPNVKVGFSKFCSLRPKWCIPVTSNSMHNVCVCEIHQNLKLMSLALPLKTDYKSLMLEFVCSTDNRTCMIQRCEYCPSENNFKNYLNSLFDQMEIDQEDNVSYKQWARIEGQTKLLAIRETVSEFVSKLTNMIGKALQHHFVAKAQAAYLRELKDNLALNHAIVLLDFAENYSFIVQDAVQGFHWENTQCTLHPFVIYSKNEDEMICHSCCIVSDEMEHSAETVHCFIKSMISYIKEIFPRVTHLHYFSDGAASQYKNCKNLFNLCSHKMDFGLTAEWNFFATSHGKSPCDGIGGTAKRLVSRASLQSTEENQILTPLQFYEWSDKNIFGIKFLYISKDVVKSHITTLEERLSKARTVAGTRSHHKFIPTSQCELNMYRLSSDPFGTTVKVATLEEAKQNQYELSFDAISVGDYVAAEYDKVWYVALVVEAIREQLDFLLRFMKLDKVKGELHWPPQRDECFVPLNCILCILPAPTKENLAMSSSRKTAYKLIMPKVCIDNVEAIFEAKVLSL